MPSPRNELARSFSGPLTASVFVAGLEKRLGFEDLVPGLRYALRSRKPGVTPLGNPGFMHGEYRIQVGAKGPGMLPDHHALLLPVEESGLVNDDEASSVTAHVDNEGHLSRIKRIPLIGVHFKLPTSDSYLIAPEFSRFGVPEAPIPETGPPPL